MIREVDIRMSVTDLNGKHIIRDCYNAFTNIKQVVPISREDAGMAE